MNSSMNIQYASTDPMEKGVCSCLDHLWKQQVPVCHLMFRRQTDIDGEWSKLILQR